ncbi:type II secretion system protein N [Aliiglaciecola sp. CAU 1673]|uniref:type II secretion system protein N n=1 Tax=Aliiglaciecola sp. CAU 1673 TaxID=3032595 RepID=UPI0023DB7CD6|nr:type II secretion system protein N [Aliiglaciecola sp. CAU 1673]MDF2177050.1 type II secretion system protein N [Aliiglaciecola sp. CAU 1673]
MSFPPKATRLKRFGPVISLVLTVIVAGLTYFNAVKQPSFTPAETGNNHSDNTPPPPQNRVTETQDENIWLPIGEAKLRGVVESDDPEQASAIVELHGQQRSFMVGEFLFNTDISLAAVYPQKIRISKDEHHTYIPLELEGERTVVASSPSEAIQTQLEALQLIALSQVKTDQLVQGYALTPSGDSYLFQQLGLESGDILTAVNGISVLDQESRGQALKALDEESQLMLSLIRQGSPLTVYVNKSP